MRHCRTIEASPSTASPMLTARVIKGLAASDSAALESQFNPSATPFRIEGNTPRLMPLID